LDDLGVGGGKPVEELCPHPARRRTVASKTRIETDEVGARGREALLCLLARRRRRCPAELSMAGLRSRPCDSRCGGSVRPVSLTCWGVVRGRSRMES
jgi:hypothetical protein